ncbi:hypothetical protein CN918_26595 [Priestia megaterium]|nr:hypothetical protein CN918_26595 [Priestia megaterium]
MTSIESKLTTNGFRKLQEKEEKVYFDKIIELKDSSTTQQICLVFDKKKQKILSIDSYLLSQDNFSAADTSHLLSEVNHLLSS